MGFLWAYLSRGKRNEMPGSGSGVFEEVCLGAAEWEERLVLIRRNLLMGLFVFLPLLVL